MSPEWMFIWNLACFVLNAAIAVRDFTGNKKGLGAISTAAAMISLACALLVAWRFA